MSELLLIPIALVISTILFLSYKRIKREDERYYSFHKQHSFEKVNL